LIGRIISDFVAYSMEMTGYCSLQHQIKMYQTQFDGTVYVDSNVISETYQYDNNPRMEYFKNDEVLGKLTLKDKSGKDLNTLSNMQKHEMHLQPAVLPDKKLTLKFESVDTEEL
jgi:hypothetical protein